jgi:hypothetical protein
LLAATPPTSPPHSRVRCALASQRHRQEHQRQELREQQRRAGTRRHADGHVVALRPLPDYDAVGAENPVTSCDLHVLVHETAKSIPSQWSECSTGRWGSGACGRLLMQRAVRAMRVVVLDVLLQHQRQAGLPKIMSTRVLEFGG